MLLFTVSVFVTFGGETRDPERRGPLRLPLHTARAVDRVKDSAGRPRRAQMSSRRGVPVDAPLWAPSLAVRDDVEVGVNR